MTNTASKPDLATGFAEIDGEHRVQIGLLTAIGDAVSRGRNKDQIDQLLDQLLDYSKIHFASEQLLMRLYQYPHYEAHLAEHDRTLEQIETLRNDFRAGDTAVTLATLAVLNGWLTGHIRRSDSGLGQYLGQIPGAAE